jgi:AraC-like DNA-binding protein
VATVLASKQEPFGKGLPAGLATEEQLARFFGLFPFPINLFRVDGTSAFVNDAYVRMLGESAAGAYLIRPERIVGLYNILNDPVVVASGRLAGWRKAFQGSTVQFESVAQPVEEIRRNHDLPGLDVVAFYQDITAFPVFDDSDEVAFVASVMIARRVVRGRPEIARAVDYLETHWREPFDGEAAAAVAGFSTRHFAREFRRHTGHTPHDYPARLRFEKLKQFLRDPAVSVAGAFSACGLEYSSRHAGAFKERTGMTPSQYRQRELEAAILPPLDA